MCWVCGSCSSSLTLERPLLPPSMVFLGPAGELAGRGSWAPGLEVAASGPSGRSLGDVCLRRRWLLLRRSLSSSPRGLRGSRTRLASPSWQWLSSFFIGADSSGLGDRGLWRRLGSPEMGAGAGPLGQCQGPLGAFWAPRFSVQASPSRCCHSNLDTKQEAFTAETAMWSCQHGTHPSLHQGSPARSAQHHTRPLDTQFLIRGLVKVSSGS